MSLQVELFRSDDYVRYGEVPLFPLLCAFFEPLLGQPLEDASFRLAFLPVGDPSVLPGPPSMVNLRSSHGYVQVTIRRNGELIYRHPHPVREIIGKPLQEILLKREPAETHWGFGVRGEALDGIALVRPAPEISHGIEVRSRAGRAARFHVEEVTGPEPPAASLADLAAGVAEDGPGLITDGLVSVVVSEAVRHGFLVSTTFSAEVEEGGFLVGRVFRDSNSPGGYIIEIVSAIPAERTGASMLNFTFTGESFLRAGELISAREADEQLLGWYHTHLFPATDALGLSSVDINLHRSTFRRPWQVAALINIDDHERVLRFYRTDGETMARASYWVAKR
ncbi:MAG TPA: JAB N-terminal domain-containing protein [Streptosporangiaceae bacterium]|nr:JAB N-terminal domain-containing protein [Streptosporangiaceae bacterium]